MSAPRKALVVGLAKTGTVAALRLRAEGWEVRAGDDGEVAADVRTDLAAHGVAVLDAPDWRVEAAGATLVVPSPGVWPTHPALEATPRERVRSEIDLAAQRCRVPFAAVTGTNGKSTVTTLVASMLEHSGLTAAAVGNLGDPFLGAVVDERVERLAVEVSSFQLEYTTDVFRPSVAVVLAVAPDHLDWHGGFERYVGAKARIVAHQSPEDLVVVDGVDETATSIGRTGRAAMVAIGTPHGWRREGADLVDPGGHRFASLDDLVRALPHDVTNSLAAAAAAFHLGATADGVRRALRGFEGLPHRVALVGDAGGVQWYDDSKATNPHAAMHSIAAFESVVLIAGGRNKGLDLGVLAEVADHVRAVVALGEAAPEVAEAFAGARPVTSAATMRTAVRAAGAAARPGDVVLLAPGCASFDAYPSYAARGDDFAAEVAALLDELEVRP